MLLLMAFFAGGGLGGMKESGQLRFGGRERPFRAPLYDHMMPHLVYPVFLPT